MAVAHHDAHGEVVLQCLWLQKVGLEVKKPVPVFCFPLGEGGGG